MLNCVLNGIFPKESWLTCDENLWSVITEQDTRIIFIVELDCEFYDNVNGLCRNYNSAA